MQNSATEVYNGNMSENSAILEETETSFSVLETELPSVGEEFCFAQPSVDVERLLAQLNASDISERVQAARQFSEITEPRAIPQLIYLLADPCPLVRISAAYALGRNPDATAVDALIRCLDDFNDYVRKGAVWALGNCRDQRALEPLLLTLRYDIEAVRLWSASALGQLGDTQAVPTLRQSLRTDPDPAVRANSAWALGKIGDLSALNDLLQGLSDPDLGVQQDCQDALGHLGYVLDFDTF